ncbi:hypothetical protein [Campylobacter estrildidarum]|uniref:hypothetical protein n=1 Tax=Campylobacter estrildidarum TaxID=2510189 RepID=UPI0010F925ED|nr:hypothetical protein [Campylobacter estrildidarum]
MRNAFCVYRDFKNEFLELFKYRKKGKAPKLTLPKTNKDKFYTEALEKLESFLDAFSVVSKGLLEADIKDLKDDLKDLEVSKDIYVKALMACELVRFYEFRLDLVVNAILSDNLEVKIL